MHSHGRIGIVSLALNACRLSFFTRVDGISSGGRRRKRAVSASKFDVATDSEVEAVLEQQMARLLLRHLVIGVLVVAADGDIVCSNGAADEILKSGDGLLIEDGRLSAVRAMDRRRLIGFMREVAEARSE